MAIDERLKRAVDALGDRLREEIERELRSVTDELSAEAKAGRDAAVAEAIAAQAAQAAAQPAATQTVATEPPSGDTAADRLGRIVDAVRAIDETRSLTEVLDVLVAWAGGEASRVGVLLVRGSRVRGWGEENSLDLDLGETGIVADAVRTGYPASTTVSEALPAPFADAPAGADVLAIPVALAGEVVAVLYAIGGDAGSLEILARHAARAVEALTAFKIARAVARPGAPATSASGQTPSGDSDEVAARRYARLLISEIKLYHQDAVEAGQRERDLSMRLGGEIERARVLYDERVPRHVRDASDYFHDELVRTLAGGDASLLTGASAS
jgi:hypothetical protein